MVWHKIAGIFGKSNSLSFTRAELDEILGSPDYTPKDLVGLFERDLGKKFNADSGVWEKYSIKRHTLMVMGQFEKYFNKSDLPASVSKSFFRVFLTLHDIGKPDAIKKTGDRRNQHLYTVGIMNSMLGQLDFREQEIKIALALVSGDPIGDYIKGKRGGKRTTEGIAQLADDAGLPFYDLLKLLLVFYQCDAGSYTEDAGGLKSLDRLFKFDRKKGEMGFSPDVSTKIDYLKIYAKAIPVSTWLDDHDWHDVAHDNLKAWVKSNRGRLDSGEVIKGNTFRYRHNLSTGEYQIRLSSRIREALYTPRSMLLLDHNWHDIVYEDLPEWVKNKREELEIGKEIKGKIIRYHRDLKTGKYQIRLSSRIKEALYSH